MKLKLVAESHKEMIKFFPSFALPSVKAPSKKWLEFFKERNGLKSVNGTPIEKIRSETATIGNITWWYENIMSQINWEEYDAKFVFNADETMLQQSGKKVVIVPKTVKRPLIKMEENSEHVTIMSCIAANGDSMTPLFIFPLKTLPKELDDLIAAEKLTISGHPEGWIDRIIFIEWVKKFVDFVSQRRTLFKTPNAKTVLFVDAHNSREAPEALKLMQENNIICITYPPDCTHILQALDVGIFGPFKKYLQTIREGNDDAKLHWNGDNYSPTEQAVRRVKLIIAAVDGLRQATTISNIKSAFEKAGIWPVKLEKPLVNPRLGVSTAVTVNMTTPKKRKKVSIASKIITASEVIASVEQAQNAAEEERYVE